MECGTPPSITIFKERRGNLYLSVLLRSRAFALSFGGTSSCEAEPPLLKKAP